MNTQAPSYRTNIIGATYLVCYCITATISNSLLHILTLPPLEVLFLRATIALSLFIMIFYRQLPTIIQSHCPKLQGMRAIAVTGDSSLWIWGLQFIPLGQAVGTYSCNVLLTSIGAVLLFKERLTRDRSLVIIAGFIGLWLILQPEQQDFNYYSLLPLGATLCYSVSCLFIKKIASYDSMLTSLFYLLLGSSILSFLLGVSLWQWPTYQEILFLLLIGTLYLLNQYLLLKAYASAEIPFIAPFNFIRFPFSLFIGLIIFHESLTLTTTLGGCMIALAATYLVQQERPTPKNN